MHSAAVNQFAAPGLFIAKAMTYVPSYLRHHQAADTSNRKPLNELTTFNLPQLKNYVNLFIT